MANTSFPVETHFHEPKNAQDALRQANILERAQTLFQSGYTMEEVLGGGGMTIKVSAADGHGWEVNTIFSECSCPSHANDGDCKHRIAVALEQAREAAQVAALEEENRWWVEAGFQQKPLYIP